MGQFTYVSKPVEVEAINSSVLDDFNSGNNTMQLPQWLMKAILEGTLSQDLVGGYLSCATKQGNVRVNSGDWLIRLQDGEIYPCSDAVFQNKYEKVMEVRSAEAVIANTKLYPGRPVYQPDSFFDIENNQWVKATRSKP